MVIVHVPLSSEDDSLWSKQIPVWSYDLHRQFVAYSGYIRIHKDTFVDHKLILFPKSISL